MRRQPSRLAALNWTGGTAAVVQVAAAPLLPADTIFEMPARVDAQIRQGCWLGGPHRQTMD